MGQMKIQNDGQISIGGYGSNSMGSSTLNLFPKNEKAPARISFYNSVSNPVIPMYVYQNHTYAFSNHKHIHSF